ncbi:DUF2807 domain-containing protein [Sphingomonas sabuli]|uniref:DUF2807 domain-containing protein n=1 Tax=Sphingomonas sabuli TaxID=2764186 RepID=A0A7G9L0U0_9SPHN|nr:head GIN domain-containing protein [Sphingomonas sabuli]QNM82239.1 DUF2807 domain-containing protein [Sphingomonas sabuli]
MRSTFLVALGVTIAVAGCGQSLAQDGGPTVQRSYPVGQFQHIEVAGPYDVNVRTGSAPSVSGRGPQALMDKLVVEIRGDRLYIHPEKTGNRMSWSGREKATLNVTVPMLRGAAIAGSGDVTIDRIAGNDFDGSISGSGDLNLASLNVQTLELSIAGSGGLTARAGQANRAAYKIAGSGDIDARGVRTGTASLSIAGSGNIAGHASNEASVSIVGSGDVALTGGAKCSVSKAGSGSVRCS